MPEQALQKGVAQLLDMVLASPVEWTAIGHGGGGRVRGAILKAMGLKPGWPDIIISTPFQHCRANASLMVGIELKALEGSVDEHQKIVHSRLEKSGWRIYVCRSLEEVLAALDDSGTPYRPVRLWPRGAMQLVRGEKV